MWNHYANHNERTNNFVEGDNHKMKTCMPAGKPDIETFTHNLRMFEATAADKYKNACLKGAHADINVISPKRRKRENEFRMLRRLRREEAITYAKYHSSILNLYKFEPKQKYLEIQSNLVNPDKSGVSGVLSGLSVPINR